MSYFGGHNHTYYSNLRLIDSINFPADLIDKAAELGLSGIAITDHECLSAHMEAFEHMDKVHEKYPDFKLVLGNEIYLTDTRDSGQKYYHFILMAKDKEGYEVLRKLSTIAWTNIYKDRNFERVPTLKSELKKEMEGHKGHVIATSACIGGELPQHILRMEEARGVRDNKTADYYYNKIIDFINFCVDVFGDDFYIECAPSNRADQILVNKKMRQIAQCFGIKMTTATDAHYLTEKERPIHKAFLNSKDGEREVDEFYEFARLMDEDECRKWLEYSFDDEFITELFNNTLEIQNKISDFEMRKKQAIPKVDVKDYPRFEDNSLKDYPTLFKLKISDNIQERYWLNECLIALKEKGLDDKKEYLERLETEADVVVCIGEKLDDCLFAYFNTFQHYIDLFWECGSIVGPGRGSSTGFLSNYLMGITQLDPIRWKLPYWRFLNKERAELPDIDIDLAPSKRPEIFRRMREERGEFKVAQVVTFGTESTKAAILTACRGYRSEDYPEGIDVDEAREMSSMVPQNRGITWSLNDMIYGDVDTDKRPVTAFIRKVQQYPGLLDIMLGIGKVISSRGVHASGVILYGDDPYETSSFMKTTSGDIVTCFDLHKAEDAGDTKYDFLVTKACDKIITCYNLLKKDGQIPDISIREFYNQYLHPEVINSEDPVIWEHLAAGDVLDVFQFATGVGLMIAKKLKPKSMLEMTAASALMRLMAEHGKESPQDRFVRIQNNPGEFELEMVEKNLTEAQRKAFHHYCDEYYGTVPLQEQMMEILMDPDIAKFTLAEANAARKIVAKKKMDQIPKLKKQLYEKVNDNNYADYIWEIAVAPSLGYAFSKNHSLPYSFVGVQMIYLASHFNSMYWNTACLIVNSGAVDAENAGNTNYAKIAQAIGEIQNRGIKISLIDINKSDFGFLPDIENNTIRFGLKGLLNVSDNIIGDILENRPYVSPKDFVNKVKPKKQEMISLIKAGAFDGMMDRKQCMGWYIWSICGVKRNITLQNMPSLIKYAIIPQNTEEEKLALRVYHFNKFLKAECKKGDSYLLNDRAITFLLEIEEDSLINQTDNGSMIISQNSWDKVYQRYMDLFRAWIAAEKPQILNSLNSIIFKEEWIKQASGSLSAWEMEVLGFYYHEHELSHLDKRKYGIKSFFDLPPEPIKNYNDTYHMNGKIGYRYYLHTICGTCIAKNKPKSEVSLLTTEGVVTVKFRKEMFVLFDKQISARDSEGIKHIIDKSWFNRGEMIMVTGIRSGDQFLPKTYQSTPIHQLYKIMSIDDNGELVLVSERAQGEDIE